MQNLVRQFFIKVNEEYIVNEELNLNFKNYREVAQFLIEVIREWEGKTYLSCGNNYKDGENEELLPENKRAYGYKTPSVCGGCIRMQKILDKIFGDKDKFNKLCFVKFHGDREYSFTFNLLKNFAEHGKKSTLKKIVEIEGKEKLKKEQEEEAQARQMEQRISEEIDEITKVPVDKNLKNFLIRKYNQESLDRLENFKLVENYDFAVFTTMRSEWFGNAGTAYFDQVNVYYKGDAAVQEWQWRDHNNPNKDKYANRIEGIGNIEVVKEDDSIKVQIELLNEKYGNRNASFVLKQKPTSEPLLSKEEQQVFEKKTQEAINNIIQKLTKSWEKKPEMTAEYQGIFLPSGSFRSSYRKPSVVKKEILADLGIAAFVTEEQIGHLTNDPQLRYELYLLKFTDSWPILLFEDHSYLNREGGSMINIISLDKNQLVVTTREGLKKFDL